MHVISLMRVFYNSELLASNPAGFKYTKEEFNLLSTLITKNCISYIMNMGEHVG